MKPDPAVVWQPRPRDVRGLVRHGQPAPVRPRDARAGRRALAGVADALDAAASIPVRVVFKPVVTTPERSARCAAKPTRRRRCVGLIAWMHTFSPAKMWIAGLAPSSKPFVHSHTQFNRDIPWADIDMDFMNLNQAAHGDREFGFIAARMRLDRKVVVGHWPTRRCRTSSAPGRAPPALARLAGRAVRRFGDNMREVAVTEGDKVEAQRRLGLQRQRLRRRRSGCASSTQVTEPRSIG